MSTPPRLFSYVVDHDHGHSPNPTGGLCTLAFCKYNTAGRRNVVELAQKGDWVIGTGGASTGSAGHGRLVYAMRVTEKLTLRDYFRDPRFTNRAGNDTDLTGRTDMFALVSDHFFYFGSAAPKFAKRHAEHPIEKRGPHFRSDFSDDFITDFVTWLEERHDPGIHGSPCEPVDDEWGGYEPSNLSRKCSSRPRDKC